MVKRHFLHGHHTIFPIVAIVLSNINLIEAQGANGTCNPMNCVALCEPTCNDEDVCMLKTMKQCGVCPPSVCLNRAAMGIPPLVKNNTKSGPSNGDMIGGIVGGLIGLGILVSVGVYFYIKKGKKREKLPFAFTNMSGISQDQSHYNIATSPPQTPHPAVIAALTHHQNDLEQSRELEELSALSPRPVSNKAPIGLNSIATPLFNNTSTNNVVPPITTIPEEFEERIALQNKRISHILNNNPRLSQHQATLSQIQTNFDNDNSKNSNRNSAMTYTTDDDSEFDYEEKVSAVRQVRISQPITQAIQMNRAKPQIMRVNSVRTAGGLNRSDSVKTILTVATPSSIVEEDIAIQFPQIPNNRIDDPFQDNNK